MNLPFHRKYRPQKFADLDQERVRNFFAKVLTTGNFGQAYLFSGPKGTGKTSAARILAMCVNCEKNSKMQTQNSKLKTKNFLNEPCGNCSSCIAIKSSASTAVTEIDAASNRGIDDIRILRERVNLLPADGTYAVFIIDEVHMLTTEAFNALLKTLEEPPAHVIFCLCTTEERKLPATIISRCVRVPYQRSTNEEIKHSLQRVITGESINITPTALDILAQQADGSFRDATVLLETVSHANPKITDSDIISTLRLASQNQVTSLFNAILSGNSVDAFNIVDTFEKLGVDYKLVTRLLIARALDQLRTQVTDKKIHKNLVQFIEIISRCFARFADVPVPALALEMAIVEYCLGIGSITTVENKVSRPANELVKQEDSKLVSNDKAESKTIHKPQTTSRKKVALDLPIKSDLEHLPDSSQELVEPEKIQDTETVPSIDEQLVRSQWSEILQGVAKHNHGLVTLMRRAEFDSCTGNTIVLAVGYKFHKEQLEQDRYLKVIESVCQQFWGVKVRVSVRLKTTAGLTNAIDPAHENITAKVSKEDQDMVETVEEIFGV